MKRIELIKNLSLSEISGGGKSKQVKEIFSGARRRLVEVKLRNNEVLTKHKAQEPITVLCLAGNGVFRAGEDLNEECQQCRRNIADLGRRRRTRSRRKSGARFTDYEI
ncbi:MAG: hypothetical protein M3033_14795 [Acidobacteriota bacterium]|nr:hypothetical protein [Acidobacteriota bacterium]